MHEHLLLDGIRQLSSLEKLHIEFLLFACDWVDTEIFTKVYYAGNIIAEIVITSISVGQLNEMEHVCVSLIGQNIVVTIILYEFLRTDCSSELLKRLIRE